MALGLPSLIGGLSGASGVSGKPISSGLVDNGYMEGSGRNVNTSGFSEGELSALATLAKAVQAPGVNGGIYVNPNLNQLQNMGSKTGAMNNPTMASTMSGGSNSIMIIGVALAGLYLLRKKKK